MNNLYYFHVYYFICGYSGICRLFFLQNIRDIINTTRQEMQQ